MYLEDTVVVLNRFFTVGPELFLLLCHNNDEHNFDDEDYHRGEQRHVESFKQLGKLLLADSLSHVLKHAKLDERERDKANEPKNSELREKGRHLRPGERSLSPLRALIRSWRRLTMGSMRECFTMCISNS